MIMKTTSPRRRTAPAAAGGLRSVREADAPRATAGQRLPVIGWPRIVARVGAGGPSSEQPDDGTDTDRLPQVTGELVINGITMPCRAESVAVLRTGIIARCVQTAVALGRPVRVEVTEADRSWRLAIRPDGIVCELAPDNTIGPVDGLAVAEGRCRSCLRINPVTAIRCERCGVEHPHDVFSSSW